MSSIASTGIVELTIICNSTDSELSVSLFAALFSRVQNSSFRSRHYSAYRVPRSVQLQHLSAGYQFPACQERT
jgi:hypothetical protein